MSELVNAKTRKDGAAMKDRNGKKITVGMRAMHCPGTIGYVQQIEGHPHEAMLTQYEAGPAGGGWGIWLESSEIEVVDEKELPHE